MGNNPVSMVDPTGGAYYPGNGDNIGVGGSGMGSGNNAYGDYMDRGYGSAFGAYWADTHNGENYDSHGYSASGYGRKMENGKYLEAQSSFSKNDWGYWQNSSSIEGSIYANQSTLSTVVIGIKWVSAGFNNNITDFVTGSVFNSAVDKQKIREVSNVTKLAKEVYDASKEGAAHQELVGVAMKYKGAPSYFLLPKDVNTQEHGSLYFDQLSKQGKVLYYIHSHNDGSGPSPQDAFETQDKQVPIYVITNTGMIFRTIMTPRGGSYVTKDNSTVGENYGEEVGNMKNFNPRVFSGNATYGYIKP